MPARKVHPGTGRKRRAPRIADDEMAATTQAAVDLAKEVNAQIEELRRTKEASKLGPEERRRRNLRATTRRRRKALAEGRELKCHGTNMAGNPCRLGPLLPSNWDGPEEISGLYCLHHEPSINHDQRESFRLFGSSKKPVPRKVTPAEMAHLLIQKSPQHFIAPYLKALGLTFDEDGELVKQGTGLKLYGYGRDGTVRRSQYPDLIGQVNVMEKLMDRVYGKARQSDGLASSVTSVSLNLNIDNSRVDEVTNVLIQAGALMAPNGHGTQDVIDSAAKQIDPPIDSEAKDLT